MTDSSKQKEEKSLAVEGSSTVEEPSAVEESLTVKEPSTEKESLIDFPCDFPVKVMGAAIPEFHTCIENIAKKHDPEFITDEITQNTSKTGKYVSLTLNIHAKDKAQLDRLYQELTDHELVLWAL